MSPNTFAAIAFAASTSALVAADCESAPTLDNAVIKPAAGGVAAGGDTCTLTDNKYDNDAVCEMACEKDYVQTAVKMKCSNDAFAVDGTPSACTKKDCAELESTVTGFPTDTDVPDACKSGKKVGDTCEVVACKTGVAKGHTGTCAVADADTATGSWTMAETDCSTEPVCAALDKPATGLAGCAKIWADEECEVVCANDQTLSDTYVCTNPKADGTTVLALKGTDAKTKCAALLADDKKNDVKANITFTVPSDANARKYISETSTVAFAVQTVMNAWAKTNKAASVNVAVGKLAFSDDKKTRRLSTTPTAVTATTEVTVMVPKEDTDKKALTMEASALETQLTGADFKKALVDKAKAEQVAAGETAWTGWATYDPKLTGPANSTNSTAKTGETDTQGAMGMQSLIFAPAVAMMATLFA